MRAAQVESRCPYCRSKNSAPVESDEDGEPLDMQLAFCFMCGKHYVITVDWLPFASNVYKLVKAEEGDEDGHL